MLRDLQFYRSKFTDFSHVKIAGAELEQGDEVGEVNLQSASTQAETRIILYSAES